jgi:hypothetical protein
MPRASEACRHEVKGARSLSLESSVSQQVATPASRIIRSYWQSAVVFPNPAGPFTRTRRACAMASSFGKPARASIRPASSGGRSFAWKTRVDVGAKKIAPG